MKRMKETRETVLKASRDYYARRAYYYDLMLQQRSTLSKTNKREVDFLKHTLSANAARPVNQVLDVACGSGRHVFELAKMGMIHYLRLAGFREIGCYPDWEIKPREKPKAEALVFVSRKD